MEKIGTPKNWKIAKNSSLLVQMPWLGDYVILTDANMQRKIWGQSKNQRKILRKMQASPFFSTLIWLEKNTSQKLAIASDCSLSVENISLIV